MIYIAIDDNTKAGEKMVQLMEEMPFAKIYRELNTTTKKALKEIEEGKTIKADNVSDLLKKLKK